MKYPYLTITTFHIFFTIFPSALFFLAPGPDKVNLLLIGAWIGNGFIQGWILAKRIELHDRRDQLNKSKSSARATLI